MGYLDYLLLSLLACLEKEGTDPIWREAPEPGPMVGEGPMPRALLKGQINVLVRSQGTQGPVCQPEAPELRVK